MAQSAGLVRDQDYSAPGTWLDSRQVQYENGRPELGAQRLRTVVRSFVAQESTSCITNVARKRTSGVRCSTSGAGEEEGEEEGEDEGEDEDEENVEAEVGEEERKKRRKRRSRTRRGGNR